MAFTRVNPGDPIQAQNLDQVIDALSGAATKGQPIALTALNDAANYAETIQNLDPTNSRALNVLKSDGTTLIKADVTGVTLGSPLNLPTGSVTSAAIANAGVANVDLGPDVARANLLVDPGFEIWQRGVGPFTTSGSYSADRWSIALTGSDTLSVSRDTTNVDAGSAAAAACTFVLSGGTGNTNIGQAITDNPQLNGQTLSLSMRVRTNVANAVRIALNDGTPVYSAFHTGSGSYQTLTVSKTISGATFGLQVVFAVSCTAYIDNACLVVGAQPANYVPLHPADDLARCLRYYEVIGGDASANFPFINGYNAAGQTVFTGIPYKAWKAVAPTVTKVGTWTLSNVSAQPTLLNAAKDGCVMQATISGTGYGYAIPTSTGTYLTVEANP